MKKRIIILLIFSILIAATAVSARDCGYIRIVKFNDANQNRVWDQEEVGVPAFTFAVVGPEAVQLSRKMVELSLLIAFL